MGPASKFDDLGTTLEEDFFGVDKGAPPEDDDSEPEEQLIEDGNNQILKDFEARKKSREYSRTQTSRGTKAQGITMSYVDWSGFSAAAHSPAPSSDIKKATDRKQRHLRRSSLQNDVNPAASDMDRRAVIRSQRRLSCGAAAGTPTEQAAPQAAPPPPPRREAQRHRSRRHNKGDAGTTPPERERIKPPAPSRANRRSSLDNGGRSQRAERRGSSQGGRSSTRAARAPRTTMSNIAAKSLSPAGRIRRPVVAAAASTTLDVRRKNMLRSASGKRPTSTRNFNVSGSDADGFLNKARSIRW